MKMNVSMIFFFLLGAAALVDSKRDKENLNRDTTPFWLEDPNDGMCLGLDGFGPCDVNSLWILASTNLKKKTVAFVSMLAPEADRMCLGSASGGIFSSRRPVGVSKCGSSNAKNLDLADMQVQGASGYLLAQNGKNCLARAQGKLRNTADMQLCTQGTPLNVAETPIHTAGMQIQTVDDYCFDGARFRKCNDGDPTLRWGIGMDFRAREPSRNLFYFFDKDNCAVREGESGRKGDCNSRGAAYWGWRDGRLSQGDKYCLGRTRDNMAIFVPCTEGFEYVDFVTPEIVPTVTKPKFGEREKGSNRKSQGGPRRYEF